MLTLTPDFYDPSGPARYLQLARTIHDLIRDGHLEPGEVLPTEQAVAELAGVAKSVVRQAFVELESHGAIERRNGRPARVTPVGVVRELSMQRYRDEEREEIGLDLGAVAQRQVSAFTQGHHIEWADYRVEVSIDSGPATPRDRVLLRLRKGNKVFRRSFVKYAGDVPVEIQRSAFPAWVVNGKPFLLDPAQQPAPGGTQRELWRAGHRVAYLRHTTRARMPSREEARVLRIAKQPVFDVERVMYDEDYRAVESSRLVLPAARHVLVDELEIGTLTEQGVMRFHRERVEREGL